MTPLVKFLVLKKTKIILMELCSFVIYLLVSLVVYVTLASAPDGGQRSWVTAVSAADTQGE